MTGADLLGLPERERGEGQKILMCDNARQIIGPTTEK